MADFMIIQKKVMPSVSAPGQTPEDSSSAMDIDSDLTELTYEQYLANLSAVGAVASDASPALKETFTEPQLSRTRSSTATGSSSSSGLSAEDMILHRLALSFNHLTVTVPLSVDDIVSSFQSLSLLQLSGDRNDLADVSGSHSSQPAFGVEQPTSMHPPGSPQAHLQSAPSAPAAPASTLR